MPALTLAFEAIGTHWQIESPLSVSKAQQHKLLQKILNRIDVFDQHYSRFRADSLVFEMAKQADVYNLPPDGFVLLSLYEQLYRLTNGQFTPLIGQALADAGYDEHYSLKQSKPLEIPPAWDEVISYTHSSIEMKRPALLDFGAGGKGYLIDIVASVMKTEGLSSFTIDAGGDILHLSESNETLRVGLENPANTTEVIGVASISNQSICGSAGNRRVWETFHHVLHPTELKSPKHIQAVWVVADSTLLADALSTCLFFVSPQLLETQFRFEYLLLGNDFRVRKSQGFPVELFTI